MHSLQLLAQAENKNCTRSWMRSLAVRLISEKNKPALRRPEKRRKTALVCWFAENCQELLIPARPVLTIPILPAIPSHPGEQPAFDKNFDGDEPWLDVELSDSTEGHEDEYLYGFTEEQT
jgi:hypothetical protein